MNKIKDYLALKKTVEEAQQNADKAEGALEQVMKQLKDDFGCSTLVEAKKKLKQLQKQEENITTEFDEAVESFEEKWEGKE